MRTRRNECLHLLSAIKASRILYQDKTMTQRHLWANSENVSRKCIFMEEDLKLKGCLAKFPPGSTASPKQQMSCQVVIVIWNRISIFVSSSFIWGWNFLFSQICGQKSWWWQFHFVGTLHSLSLSSRFKFRMVCETDDSFLRKHCFDCWTERLN